MTADDVMGGIAGVLSSESKAKLLEHVMTPEYQSLVLSVAKSLWEHRRQHPTLDLRWKNTEGVLVIGNPELRESLYRLADSKDGVEALVKAYEATGKKASLLTLQLALVYLGWLR